MQLWKTKYIAKKPVTRVEQENNFAPGIWVPVFMAKRPMASLEDGYLFVMNLYVEGMEPTPFSPFDHVVVTEQELNEYFEELSDEVHVEKQ